MKQITTFKELKKWRKVTGMIFVLALLIFCMATLLASDDPVVAVRSLFIVFLTIIARRLLP
jgi:hypothetical protein